MNKRKYSILSLVMMSPLLMANSPAPYPSDSYYSDVEVTCFYLGQEKNEYQDLCEKYQITIKNIGNLYPLMNHSVFLNDTYLRSHFDGVLFYNECLPINEQKTYTFLTDKQLDLDPEHDVWSFDAVDLIDENVTFSDYSMSRTGEKEYHVNTKISGIGDYYYAAIIDITYDGVRYAFYTNISSGKKQNEIHTKEELDLTKLSIDKITAFRSSYNTYQGGKVLYGIFIGFIVCIGILIVGVPAGIIIPISIVRHKRKKRESISEKVDS